MQTQFVMEELPSSKVVEFGRQLVHTVGVVAPTVLDALPTPQAVHALAPAPAYVPARQSTHTLALLAPVRFELLPAAQLIHTLAPVTPEYVPAVQSRHNDFPVTFLNFPATHAVHVSPSLPVYPMLHLQFEIFFGVIENGVFEFTGHDTHTLVTKEICKSAIVIYVEPQPLFIYRYTSVPSGFTCICLIYTYLPVKTVLVPEFAAFQPKHFSFSGYNS